jgi:hypothetical protein
MFQSEAARIGAMQPYVAQFWPQSFIYIRNLRIPFIPTNGGSIDTERSYKIVLL